MNQLLLCLCLCPLRPPPPDPPAPRADAPVPSTPPPALRGDLGIRGFVETGTTAIFDVRVVNLDCATHSVRKSPNVLQSVESQKSKKYGPICASRRESFHPFIASADGLLGSQAQKVLQRLGRLISERSSRPYSVVVSHLRQRISITLARSIHFCLRTSREKRSFHLLNHPAPDTLTSPTPEFMLQFG